eukprot:UN08582
MADQKQQDGQKMASVTIALHTIYSQFNVDTTKELKAIRSKLKEGNTFSINFLLQSGYPSINNQNESNFTVNGNIFLSGVIVPDTPTHIYYGNQIVNVPKGKAGMELFGVAVPLFNSISVSWTPTSDGGKKWNVILTIMTSDGLHGLLISNGAVKKD